MSSLEKKPSQIKKKKREREKRKTTKKQTKKIKKKKRRRRRNLPTPLPKKSWFAFSFVKLSFVLF